MPKMKQATLTSLKGVVVVEDFIRHKNVLENEKESEENIIGALVYLKKKKPCKEVISSTGIDNTLKVLVNNSNEKIVAEAKKLIDLWDIDGCKKVQPTIEVRYDNLTRHIRRSAVRLFTETLGGQESDEKCADTLEKEIFHTYKRLISKSYKRAVRKVVFVLRHQEQKRDALKKGHITHLQFVSRCLTKS